MLTTTRCISLKTVRYKDTRWIVTCFSRDFGRIAFTVAGGQSPESRRRKAMLMPGAAFDCTVDFREGRELQTFKDPSPSRVMILDHPAKSSVILFICDFLNTLLRDSQPDKNLFDYIDKSVDMIVDGSISLANATLCFLVGLQHFMGIEPDISTYRRGSCLDLRGGVFRQTPPLHGNYLDPADSEKALLLLRMTPANSHHFKLDRAAKTRALDIMIDYYSIHFTNLRNLKSLPVLRQLFE